MRDVARHAAERVSLERSFLLPPGTELCPCEPLEVHLSGTESVTLQAAELARHAGLPVPTTKQALAPVGALAGAVFLPSWTVTVLLWGWSWPVFRRVGSWRHVPVCFTHGDRLQLGSHRPATVLLWPVISTKEPPCLSTV